MNPYLRPSSSLVPRASNATLSLLRPASTPRTVHIRRFSATSPSSSSRRRNVGVLSDDGRYQWGELTGREKVARATQQSLNVMVVLAGAVLTGSVFYLLYLEVFSPNSKTWQFEKAVERIKDDSRCTALLGDRREIRAYGDTTGGRWGRQNRPLATSTEKDRLGREHLRISFLVEGPTNRGTVVIHLMKPLNSNEWEYQLLALDVKGHRRIVLEEAAEKPGASKEIKIFGIKFR